MSKFKVGDKVRALANPTDPYYSNDGYFKAGEEFTVKEVFSHTDTVSTVSLVEKGECWHVSRFELVEDVKPAVAPQLPGIPEGFRAVRIGTPAKGDWYVFGKGVARQSEGCNTASSYVILEKLDQPAPVEPAKPEAPVAPAKKVAPVFKVGDKVRLVNNTGCVKFPVGTVDTIVKTTPDVPTNSDLLTFAGPLKSSRGMFELVTESPDDLVVQDRVPARDGIDFGWWVNTEDFDNHVPTIEKTWKMGSGWEECVGLTHGHADDWGSRLAVTCYRKDLPVLPTTEKVVLKEYVVWDDGGAKCIIWSSEDPSVENDVLEHWDHAHPTGNTREVEVPLVKA